MQALPYLYYYNVPSNFQGRLIHSVCYCPQLDPVLDTMS